jgi:hypothetical protein
VPELPRHPPDTAASFGPVIVHSLSPRFEVNEGGCVALALGDSSANGCGANLQALRQCTAAACAGCAGTPDAVRSDGCLCETAAQGGACKTYVGPASCVTPYVKAGDPDINGCVGGVYFLVARYFCLAH